MRLPCTPSAWPLCVLLLALSGVLPSGAQFTLPGGIKVQVPNARPQPTRPVRVNPDDVCPNLVNWVKPLHAEYPTLDLMHVELGRLAGMEIPLFADQNFVPFFHKSYTQMTPTELDAIFKQQMMPCMQSGYRNQLPGVDYAFQTRSSGSLSYSRLPTSLNALQQARTTLAQTLTGVAALPATAQSYDSLQSTRGAAGPSLALVWPSEREAFNQSINAAQGRLAPAALEGKLAPLLTQPPTLQTLQALHGLPTQNAALLKQLPPDPMQSFQQRINARSAAIGATLLAQQRATMLSFPATEAGLKDGAAWLSTFEPIYLGLVVAGADDLVHEYEQRREKQLATREPEIRRRLEAAPTEYALKPMLDGIFVLRSDQATPLYARMQQVVVARSEVLERRETAASAAQAQAETRQAAVDEAKRAAQDRQTARVTPRNSTAHADTRVADPHPTDTQNLALTASSFNSVDLSNRALLQSFYTGDFEKIGLERGDLNFSNLFSDYLNAYSDSCNSSLPRNKVMMTRQKCDSWHYQTTNGMRSGPDICDGWTTEPTGKEADPALYSALKSLGLQSTREVLRTTLSMLGGSNPIATALNMVGDAATMDNDISSLVQKNACTSPALLRFQENVRLFALGKQPIRLDGTQQHMIGTDAPRAGATFKDSDYSRFMEDLVFEQSKTWAMNHYARGSVSGVRVTLRDSVGRPSAIEAGYSFSGFSGNNSHGSVTLKFNEGIPECLLFSDMPIDCRTPNRKIVSAYAGGGYQ